MLFKNFAPLLAAFLMCGHASELSAGSSTPPRSNSFSNDEPQSSYAALIETEEEADDREIQALGRLQETIAPDLNPTILRQILETPSISHTFKGRYWYLHGINQRKILNRERTELSNAQIVWGQVAGNTSWNLIEPQPDNSLHFPSPLLDPRQSLLEKISDQNPSLSIDFTGGYKLEGNMGEENMREAAIDPFTGTYHPHLNDGYTPWSMRYMIEDGEDFFYVILRTYEFSNLNENNESTE